MAAGAQISYRAAVPADSNSIADFICMAGGGLYEFLFDDLIPFVTARDILSAGVERLDPPISYLHCHVAVDGASGRLVGAANAFPADLLRNQDHALLPVGRMAHVRSMLEVQDWGSFFVNALAVSAEYRGHGIGGGLLAWAEEGARAAQLDRVSLHVWADNTTARALYQRLGFVEIALAEVAEHPRLPHRGGSILMRKMLSRAPPCA